MAGNRVKAVVKSAAARVIAWQCRHGRHDLPWQNTRDAYRIWLSEVMLQQTQVSTVIPYYARFLKRFPTVAALARAPLDDVLALWSGLGYYSRARNLHKAAQALVTQYRGCMPQDPTLIEALPGIGRSTAAAIAVFAYGGRHAILDGNVKRVLARYRGVRGFTGSTAVSEELWRHAQALLPQRQIEVYTQGLMDLGAGVCTRTRPACERCPLSGDCVARREGLTEQLPEPRPRAAVPTRKTVMLMVRTGGQLLLEKRAASGLWGGLWSLPEINSVASADAFCLSAFGAPVKKRHTLPAFTHAFTHFRLRIKPVVVEIEAVNISSAKSAQRRWFAHAAALRAAIPTPVRNIILRL